MAFYLPNTPIFSHTKMFPCTVYSFHWPSQCHKHKNLCSDWGWQVVRSMKWRVVALSKLKTSNSINSLVPLSAAHITQKQLNQWPTSLVSLVVVYIWLSACQRKMEPLNDHPNTHEHLTSLTIKQHGNFRPNISLKCIYVFSYILVCIICIYMYF